MVKVASSPPQAPWRVQLIGRVAPQGASRSSARPVTATHLDLICDSFFFLCLLELKGGGDAGLCSRSQTSQVDFGLSVQTRDRPIGPDIDKTDTGVGPGLTPPRYSKK